MSNRSKFNKDLSFFLAYSGTVSMLVMYDIETGKLGTAFRVRNDEQAKRLHAYQSEFNVCYLIVKGKLFEVLKQNEHKYQK